MALLLISGSFLLFYAVMIIQFKRSWDKLPEFKSPMRHSYTFISVLIPARNEETTITYLLQALKEQTYPKEHFEIIVIDDYSTDVTSEKVKNFPLPNIHIIQPYCPADQSSKKKAIESGVAYAKGELIITTDADCIPGPLWLATINDYYKQTNASLIAAPVKFIDNSSLLSKFQALDFLTLQGITAASVASNALTMCNGANLAYTKKIFLTVNGFNGIDHIATGDDMLLMYKIYSEDRGKVMYLKNKNAIVASLPMSTWREFLQQRKRWASKTFVFKDLRITWALLFVFLLNLLFPALILFSIFHSVFWIYTIAFILLKSIIEWPFVYSVARFYNEQSLMRYFILFQPLHMLYTVVIGIISQTGTYEWKGRRTK